MLTRAHRILIGLLVVQIALVVLTHVHGREAAPVKDTVVLAGFDAKAVTRVQIYGPGEPKPVDLVKSGTTWVVASAWNYPAEATKIEAALAPLATMMAGAPIATQVARHAQLKVGDASFERKVVITAGGRDTTLYIGAPAGQRRTAVRVGSATQVLAASGITAYAFGADAHAWVDPKYVAISKTELTRVEIAKGDQVIALTASTVATGDGSSATPVPPPAVVTWSATINGAAITPGPDEALDTATIEQVATQLSAIALAQPADPKRDASKPLATITIEHAPAGAAAPVSDVLDVLADGDGYYVHRRGAATAVTVDKGQLDTALALERMKLVTKAAPAAGSDSMGSAMDLQGLPPGLEGMQMPPGMMPSP